MFLGSRIQISFLSLSLLLLAPSSITPTAAPTSVSSGPKIIQRGAIPMAHKKYSAIVFDLGGVLVDDSAAAIAAEKAYPGIGASLMKAIYRKHNWNDLDRGLISIEAFAAGIEQKLGYEAHITTHILKNLIKELPILPRGLEILHVAKAQGYKVYVLSNIYEEALKSLAEEHPFFRLFDGVLASCDVGLVKPESAIYTKLLQTFNLTPETTLFIDDVEANVAAAAQSGIDGIVCKDPEAVLKLLRETNVLRKKISYAPLGETKLMQAAKATPAALKKYRALVLDLGGVLVAWNPEITTMKLFPNTPAAAAVGALFHDPAWLDFDRGITDIAALSQLAQDKYFFDKLLTAQALEAIGSSRPLIPECIKIMHLAKEQGYKLYVLSNHPQPYIEDYLRVYPEIFGLFDGFMVSYETGHLKPHANFYQDFFNKFPLKPEECLFIDDVAENIIAGNAFGMDGIVCENHNEVLRILEENSILKIPPLEANDPEKASFI